jgi:hypothetical protein
MQTEVINLGNNNRKEKMPVGIRIRKAAGAFAWTCLTILFILLAVGGEVYPGLLNWNDAGQTVLNLITLISLVGVIMFIKATFLIHKKRRAEGKILSTGTKILISVVGVILVIGVLALFYPWIMLLLIKLFTGRLF